MAPSALLLVLVLAVCCAVCSARVVVQAPRARADDALFELSVVHLNDFHARFQPTAPSGGACPAGQEDTCVGGIARVVTQARALQKERPNALLLNGGDNFQGTLWYSEYGWNVTAEFLNYLQWDAIALGNHEFDRKLAGVIPFIEAMDSTFVAANIDASKEPSFQDLYEKSVVVVRGGRQIGIIGLIVSNTPDISSPEGLLFLPEVAAVAEEGARLRADGVDIIVVLSHSGIEVDLEVAAADANVDLVVGAHSHTLLYTGSPPGGETPYDVYPIIVEQESGRKVAVVQAGAYTKYLGNLTAFFDAGGELVSAEGNPIYLDKSVVEDPDTLEALQPWADGLEELAARQVGTSAVLLEQSGGACYSGECNLGSFVADAQVHAFVGRGPEGSWTRAAISFTNAGGLRTAIVPGDVTYNDLVTTLPFLNTINLMELRGASLRAALEQAVQSTQLRGPRAGPWERNYFAFLQMSGVHVVYNVSADAGSRVASVRVLCHDCTVPKYAPLDDDEWYPVAMNSFLAEGGDGYYVFPNEGRNHEIGELDTDVLQEFMKVRRPITAGRDGRIVFSEVVVAPDTTSVAVDSTSEVTTSEDTTSEDTTSEDTTSEDTTSEDTTSEDTTFEDTTSLETTTSGNVVYGKASLGLILLGLAFHGWRG